MGAAGGGVDHLLAVAVVGGDDGAAALSLDGVEDSAAADIDGFDGLNGGGENAGVADHVAVGEVDDDHVINFGIHALDHLIADFESAHLGFLVVGADFGAGDDLAVLKREGSLAVVVEEKSHMGKFFGFGRAELFEVSVGDNLAKNTLHLGRLGIGDVDGEAFFIGRHSGVVEVELLTTVEAGEVVENEGLGDLARTVATVVVENDRIAIADGGAGIRAVVADRRWGDKLITSHRGLGRMIVIPANGFDGRVKLQPIAKDHGAIGLLDTVPAIVAIHGPVAAHDGGDCADADLFGLGFDLAEILDSGIGGGIAAVGEGVQKNPRKSASFAQFQAGVEVLEQAVDAGVGDDAEQVQLGAFLHGVGDGGVELRVLEKFAAADGLGDADGFLIDDPAGADVLVADFAVAHGAFGQADVEAGGVDERRGIFGHESIRHRMLRQINRVGVVPLRIRIFPPAIADDQDEWSLFHVGHHFFFEEEMQPQRRGGEEKSKLKMTFSASLRLCEEFFRSSAAEKFSAQHEKIID